MVILNQDRTKLIAFEEQDDIFTSINIVDEVLMGYNLILHEQILGTFDTLNEAMQEMFNIKSCEYYYYVVSGFSDYLECFNKVGDINAD